MSTQELVGAKIKEIRLNRGFSKNEFAELISLSVSGLSNIESNTYAPSDSVLDKICERFAISKDSLLACKFPELNDNKEDKHIAIGKIIKQTRQKHKLTQSQMATMLGYTGNGSAQICAVEKGIRGISRDKLAIFSRNFGIPIDELVFVKTDNNKKKSIYDSEYSELIRDFTTLCSMPKKPPLFHTIVDIVNHSMQDMRAKKK